MKKTQLVFVLLVTLFTLLSASAQSEWKWAHYWSGNGGDYNNIFNKVVNTAFDDDGNIYVYGTMGGNAVFDGITLSFSNNSDVITTAEHSILLAKFDTLGVMQWYRVIKCSNGDWSIPKWMTIKNNRIYITGRTGMWGDYNYWLYYLDTLITKADVLNLPESERKPPYKRSRWTFFSQLDLDGNRLEDHFVEAYSRETVINGHEYIRYVMPLNEGASSLTPMYVDNQGNIYWFGHINYSGNEEDPYTIVIDGDTNRTYDLYLPGSSCNNLSINNAIMYKFNSDWTLGFSKIMIPSTTGIATSWEYVGDSINPRFTIVLSGMSNDEGGNMYISGHLILTMHNYDDGGQLHQYPAHIYWDSSHYATIHDMSGAARLNFVIKYDTNGNVQWCNQIYTKGDPSASSNYVRAEWKGNCIDEQYLYILGAGAYTPNSQANIYFDTENDNLQRYIPNLTGIGFFVKYNKHTGQYISHGIIPINNVNATSYTPARINNRIFATAYFNNTYNILLTEWRNDGLIIKADTFFCAQSDVYNSQGLTGNEKGYLLLSVVSYSSITFSDNVQADCNVPYLSKSVFALYHNPEFATPFVGDDTTNITSYYDKRENDIYLYPNPTSGQTSICGYMYDYKSIELYDLQGRKLADLVETWHPSAAQTMQPIPAFDLSPYPAGTYLVKINFNRGVSVVRKVVKK